MRDRPCLIIDDIDAALGCLTDVGRAVVCEACYRLRDAVLDFATRRRWTVVPHRSYVQWALDMIQSEDSQWLVLDPLFPPDNLDHRVQPVRMTRGITGLGIEARVAMDALNEASEPDTVSVLDDAAASGTTLRYVAGRVTQAGGHVKRFALCASTRPARESLRLSFRGAKWMEYMPPDDWMVIHLRDGCAYLPYAGRASQQQPIVTADHRTIELRVPATTVEASLWRVMGLDAAINDATRSLRSHVPAKLSELLQRPATVQDLSLLGANVPALIAPGQSVTAETTLESLTVAG